MSKKIKKQSVKKTDNIKQTGNSNSTQGSTDNLKPAFCFQYLHKEYNISSLNTDDKKALIEKLEELSNLTWQDIKLNGRHALGTEKISQNSIKVSVPSAITEDVSFLSIRFSGMKPMIGFRDNRIFHIVYLDHKFEVYNHG